MLPSPTPPLSRTQPSSHVAKSNACEETDTCVRPAGNGGVVSFLARISGEGAMRRGSGLCVCVSVGDPPGACARLCLVLGEQGEASAPRPRAARHLKRPSRFDRCASDRVTLALEPPLPLVPPNFSVSNVQASRCRWAVAARDDCSERSARRRSHRFGHRPVGVLP